MDSFQTACLCVREGGGEEGERGGVGEVGGWEGGRECSCRFAYSFEPTMPSPFAGVSACACFSPLLSPFPEHTCCDCLTYLSESTLPFSPGPVPFCSFFTFSTLTKRLCNQMLVSLRLSPLDLFKDPLRLLAKARARRGPTILAFAVKIFP